MDFTQESLPVNLSIDELVKRGVALMESSLEKYKKGMLDWANHDRIEANHIFNVLQTKINQTSGRDTMLYGECRNFGILYQVFENSAGKMMEENKKGFKEIINLIKENKVLNTQFKIYNAIVHPQNVNEAEQYVEDIISLTKHYSPEKLFENNEILLNKIKKNKLYEEIQINDDLMNVYEDIEFMIMNKKSFSNISNYSNIKKRLTEFVEKNKVNTKPLMEHKEEKTLMENLEDKCGLNEDEKAFLKSIPEDKESCKNLFEEQKNKTLETIHSLIKENNEEDNMEWRIVEQKVLSKTFDEKNFVSTIAEFSEIQNIISEQK